MITVESQAAVRSAPTLPLTTHLGAVRIGVSDRDKALVLLPNLTSACVACHFSFRTR